jgi:arginase
MIEPTRLVRVPRAWGDGGEAMVESAWLPFPYPEAAVIEEGSLAEQSLALARDLPARPLVLGGCCCSHVGAVEGLHTRHGRLALVWLDAHGDLNTPDTSPSGNLWGMPLRMLIDSGAVRADDVALVGARNLDPPEEAFIAHSGIHMDDAEAALEGTESAYVALDCDVFDEAEIPSFMPEPGGLTLREVRELFSSIQGSTTVLGMGLTGLAPRASSVEPLAQLCGTLGLRVSP